MTPLVGPLCIIQARLKSYRLPEKMLLKLGRETVIERGYRLACKAFYPENVVVAIPFGDKDSALDAELHRIGASVFAPDCAESDVLTRLWMVAHHHRWHPDSVIVRWTPDDPFKDPDLCRRVAMGERHPVERGAEAFTLAMLDAAHASDTKHREHITYALFPDIAVRQTCDDDRPWTLDTPDDLDRINRDRLWAVGAPREVW